MNHIYKWLEIADEFKGGAILLGNGASIAVDERFDYRSLLDKARSDGLITNDLDTQDFERVLRMLWHAQNINKALSIRETETSSTYEALKTALVQTVQKVHVPYERVKDKLLSIGNFLKSFQSVFSLNYDLIVYWTMTTTNDALGQTWFKDCFQSGSFDYDWRRYEKNYLNAEGATLVFYPHGNLALAVNLDNREEKIKASSTDLLETVLSAWKAESHSPLFVSEGMSKQKQHSIGGSPYLATVYNSVFPDIGDRIVIFGWSMCLDSDKHILEAIKESKPSIIAISVKNGKDNPDTLESRFRSVIQDDGVVIRFFDADSEGCWIRCPALTTSDCAF